jgi:endonuclease YncB( thermonuclease family)
MNEAVAAARLRRIDAHIVVIAVVILAALLFVAASAFGGLGIQRVDTSTGKTFSCTVLSVTDGDGPVMCAEQDQSGNQVQVRMRGIEAQDEDGGCRIATGCTDMTWQEGKAVLTRIAGARMQCTSYGLTYERVDSACVNAEGVDVSCELIRMGAAVRWPQFDPEGRLANCIPGRRR